VKTTPRMLDASPSRPQPLSSTATTAPVMLTTAGGEASTDVTLTCDVDPIASRVVPGGPRCP
jgi:hypothetical protein